MFKVRFHLGPGKHYMRWQVTSPDGTKRYYHPRTTELRMHNCRLTNRLRTAKRIYEGGHKTPCAWIEAAEVVVFHSTDMAYGTNQCCDGSLHYNPRIAPHWRTNTGLNVDGYVYRTVMAHMGVLTYDLSA